MWRAICRSLAGAQPKPCCGQVGDVRVQVSERPPVAGDVGGETLHAEQAEADEVRAGHERHGEAGARDWVGALGVVQTQP